MLRYLIPIVDVLIAIMERRILWSYNVATVFDYVQKEIMTTS